MNERIIEKLIDKGIRVLNNFNRNEAIEFFILNIFFIYLMAYYHTLDYKYPKIFRVYKKLINI